MADWLLFLHVLTAFMLFATVVVFSAVALGAPRLPRMLSVANLLWNVGGIGTLVFGIWLALDLSQYEVWDGWIIAAVVLWALATETGRRAALQLAAPDGTAVIAERSSAAMHWLRTVLVVLLLIVMVYKPGV